MRAASVPCVRAGGAATPGLTDQPLRPETSPHRPIHTPPHPLLRTSRTPGPGLRLMPRHHRGRGGGGGTTRKATATRRNVTRGAHPPPPPLDPPPLKRFSHFSCGPSANQKFSLAPLAPIRGVFRALDFFLLRTALRDCPKGPPTANHQSPPAATNRQSPTANRQSPPPMVEHMSYTRSFCKTAVQEHYFPLLLRTLLAPISLDQNFLRRLRRL